MTKIRKALFVFAAGMALCGVAMASDPKATAIKTSTTNFNGALSTADTDVQKALDTLDNASSAGSFAPVGATYITQTTNGTLTNEQALGSLSTGIVKNTTTTGVLSIAAAGTDYLAPAAIGTTVQAYDADLTTYAGITPSANIQSFLGSADYPTARSNLGLAIGTNVQAYDSDLTTWAGLTPSAYFQTLVDDADASTARSTLGLGTLATQSGTFSGTSSGTNTGDQTNITGNAGTVTVADAGSDTTTWPMLATSQTGSLAPATDAGLTYNATSDTLTATTFVGALTGTASGNLVSGGALGTPSSATLTNATGLPVSGITASTSTALGVGSIELGHATDTTLARSGSGAVTVEGVQVILSGAALGTPSSGTLTNATGLPISTGVTGLGTGVATALATPSSANLASAITDEVGSGSLVFGTSPKITTGINDSNNNELIRVTATGSAVNDITVANAATGANPTISATGDDSNVGINLTTKGSGAVVITTSGTPTQSTITSGLVVNNASAGNAADDFIANTDTIANALRVNAASNVIALAAPISTTSTILTSSRTTDAGWSVVTGANTACNTTCTSACVVGFDTGGHIVACTDATADECLCAGSS